MGLVRETAYLAGALLYQAVAPKFYKRRLQRNAAIALGEVAQSLEDKLRFPREGLPSIDIGIYRGVSEDEREVLMLGNAAARYDPKQVQILLNEDSAYPLVTLDREDPATTAVFSTIAHELGHYYSDCILKSRGLILEAYIEEVCLDLKSFKFMIIEGIGEYFCEAYSGKQQLDEFPAIDFSYLAINEEDPVELTVMKQSNLYPLGAAFVRPLIDEHKERGIVALLLDPPQQDDVADALAYRSRLAKKCQESL